MAVASCLIRQPQILSLPPLKLEGKYSTQNLRGHHLFPPEQVSASKTPSRNTSESDRIETGAAGGERPGRGRRGWRYQRSHRWKSRSRGSRERERGRDEEEKEGGKDEGGNSSRSSKSKSIESIHSLLLEIFLPLFPFFLASNHTVPHGRQMMRVPRGDVVTSLDVLPPFILHPANDTFSTQLSLASVISYSYGPPIRIGRSIFEVESKIMKNSFPFLNSRWKKDCAKIVFDSSRIEEKCWHGNRNRSG